MERSHKRNKVAPKNLMENLLGTPLIPIEITDIVEVSKFEKMLPPDIVIMIFAFLEIGKGISTANLVLIKKVCKYFHQVATNDNLWKDLFKHHQLVEHPTHVLVRPLVDLLTWRIKVRYLLSLRNNWNIQKFRNFKILIPNGSIEHLILRETTDKTLLLVTYRDSIKCYDLYRKKKFNKEQDTWVLQNIFWEFYTRDLECVTPLKKSNQIICIIQKLVTVVSLLQGEPVTMENEIDLENEFTEHGYQLVISEELNLLAIIVPSGVGVYKLNTFKKIFFIENEDISGVEFCDEMKVLVVKTNYEIQVYNKKGILLHQISTEGSNVTINSKSHILETSNKNGPIIKSLHGPFLLCKENNKILSLIEIKKNGVVEILKSLKSLKIIDDFVLSTEVANFDHVFLDCEGNKIVKYNIENFKAIEEFVLAYPNMETAEEWEPQFFKAVGSVLAASSPMHKLKLWNSMTGNLISSEAVPHFEEIDMSNSFLVRKEHHNIIVVNDYRTVNKEYEYEPKEPVVDITNDVKNPPVINLI